MSTKQMAAELEPESAAGGGLKEAVPSWVRYAMDAPSESARISRIVNEREPSWWNALTDTNRGYFNRNNAAGKQGAFEAGVIAGLEVGRALSAPPARADELSDPAAKVVADAESYLSWSFGDSNGSKLIRQLVNALHAEARKPIPAGWSALPISEADHAERLSAEDLKLAGLGLSKWAWEHLAQGYGVSLTVREVSRLIRAVEQNAAPTEGESAGLREKIALWLDGFMSSAEGYNGEYPFDEGPDESLKARACERIAALRAPAAKQEDER